MFKLLHLHTEFRRLVQLLVWWRQQTLRVAVGSGHDVTSPHSRGIMLQGSRCAVTSLNNYGDSPGKKKKKKKKDCPTSNYIL